MKEILSTRRSNNENLLLWNNVLGAKTRFCDNSLIENGTERQPVQKYFVDLEVYDGETEGNTYSWVRGSDETTKKSRQRVYSR